MSIIFLCVVMSFYCRQAMRQSWTSFSLSKINLQSLLIIIGVVHWLTTVREYNLENLIYCLTAND